MKGASGKLNLVLDCTVTGVEDTSRTAYASATPWSISALSWALVTGVVVVVAGDALVVSADSIVLLSESAMSSSESVPLRAVPVICGLQPVNLQSQSAALKP
ncbi:hypothetical protein Tco_1011912 [Tanacetum coccineum]